MTTLTPPVAATLTQRSVGLTNLNANILRRNINKNQPVLSIKYNLSQLKNLCDNSNKKYQDNDVRVLGDRNVQRVINELEFKLQQQISAYKLTKALQQDKSNPKNLTIIQIIDRGMNYFEQQTVGFFRQPLENSKTDFNRKLEQALNSKVIYPMKKDHQINQADYRSIIRNNILQRQDQGGADGYQLANQFYKLSKNSVWNIISYQLSGIGQDCSIQKIAHSTLRLIQNIFKQIVPIRSSINDINNYLKKQVLPFNDYDVILDQNNLNTFALLYLFLKTGQFERIDELSLKQQLTLAFKQFFVYQQIPLQVSIPRVNDTFLQDIQDIMKGKYGDPRLVQDNVDLAWRSLTILAKHPSHSTQQLYQYQKKIASDIKKCSPSQYEVLIVHLIYSLNYELLVKLPNNILGIESRVHLAIVLYSSHLLKKSLFIQVIKQYLSNMSDVSIITDYSLLLQNQDLIFQTIRQSLFKNYRIQSFFGMIDETTIQKESEYTRLSKYFDPIKYQQFCQTLLQANKQINSLSTAILYCKVHNKVNKSLILLLKQQLITLKNFRKTINIIQNHQRITPTQKQIVNFIKFYKQSLDLISNQDFQTLNKIYKNYFVTPRSMIQDAIDFLFQNNQGLVFLNYIKMKILYLQKLGIKQGQIDVDSDFDYYKQRTSFKSTNQQEKLLRQEIQNYLQ